MPASHLNEGKACDAVLRFIEAREGGQRKDIRFPEQEKHAAPIELACIIGNQLYAVEHTGIEPFEGFMQLQAEADLHFGAIKTALIGVLPPGTFQLYIPARALQGSKLPGIRKIQAHIIDWVKNIAPTLPIKKYGEYIGDIRSTSVAGVPFELRLVRYEAFANRRFEIIHTVPSDHEEERFERINRAFKKKFGKLYAWKKSDNARTILILEDIRYGTGHH